MFHNVRIRRSETSVGPEVSKPPPWVVRCIVLGAGASLGFDESLDEPERPPSTDSIFLNDRARTLLGTGRYAPLRMAYHLYCARHEKDADSDRVDAEAFAGDLAELVEEAFRLGPTHNPPTQTSPAAIAMQALGELWFFLFELLQADSARYFRRQRDTKPDAYRLLARSFREHPFSVVTTNYDALLEEAILREGLDYSYIGEAEKGRKVPIFKIHGSVTWLNPNCGPDGSAAIAFNSSGLALFRNVAQLVYGTSYSVASPRFLSVSEYREASVDGTLVRDGRDWYIPALLPPIGKFKNYTQVDFYQKTHVAAGRALAGANEVHMIGSTLRTDDLLLGELLRAPLLEGRVQGIAGNVETMCQRMAQLIGRSETAIPCQFRTFREWIEREACA